MSRDLPYISLTVDNTSASISQSGFGSSYYDYAIRSYFGRLNYSFKDRYILDFIARRDGSSRFPPNNRWAFTPGVSGAWVINKENFWNSMNDVVSNFKLRASYAKQGNQSVSYYGYLQNLPIGTSGYLIGAIACPLQRRLTSQLTLTTIHGKVLLPTTLVRIWDFLKTT
ncbi:TonB-dependent receptor [Niabella defluvii]|nr:TonB-dependent receptor [Niabella sp. I65]